MGQPLDHGFHDQEEPEESRVYGGVQVAAQSEAGTSGTCADVDVWIPQGEVRTASSRHTLALSMTQGAVLHFIGQSA